MKKILIYAMTMVVALTYAGCTAYEEVESLPFVLPFDKIELKGDESINKQLNLGKMIPGCEYIVKSEQPWINIANRGEVSWLISIKENETINERTGTIAVTIKDSSFLGSEYTQTITVIQEKGIPIASNADLVFTADRSSKTLSITTNLTNYTIKSDASWLEFNTSYGSGNTDVTVTAGVNPDTWDREATISISGNGVEMNVATVRQKGMTYVWETVSSENNEVDIEASEYAKSYTIKIKTNLSWRAEIISNTDNSTDWVTIDTPSRSVTLQTSPTYTEFKFTLADNRVANRQVAIHVYDANSGSYSPYCTTIVVNQKAIPHLSVDKESVAAAYSAGEYSVGLRAGDDWIATCDADWIILATTGGSSYDNTLKFSVAENTSEPKRTATITLALVNYPNEEKKMLTVTQLRENTLCYTQIPGTTSAITISDANVFGATILEHGYDSATCEGFITFEASPTTIGYQAFRNCSSLSSITIPDSVTSIGQAAFAYCESLTDVIIPNGVTSIGQAAFRDCKNLTNANIPNGVTEINALTFYNTALTSVTIPDSVTSIGDHAFSSCLKLANITIGNGLTSIGLKAFYDCRSLTSIVIPNGVTSIGNDAFCFCSRLTSITLPDSVTEIGKRAFKDCISLTSVNIPYGITTIGEYTFAGCQSLKNITIPDSVTEIGKQAFKDCISLTSANIPYGVTTIGEFTFAECQSLKNITIPDSVTEIGKYAFRSCESLTSIVIPNSVLSIGEGAFHACYGLIDVTIGDGVTSIGDNAFSNCESLVKFDCKPTTPPTIDGDATIFTTSYLNKNKTRIYVPKASINAYKEAEGWKEYASFITYKY